MAAVALDQGICLRGSPGARFVEIQAFAAVLVPAVEDRCNQLPGQVYKIRPGKEHRVPEHTIEQQGSHKPWAARPSRTHSEYLKSMETGLICMVVSGILALKRKAIPSSG